MASFAKKCETKKEKSKYLIKKNESSEEKKMRLKKVGAMMKIFRI